VRLCTAAEGPCAHIGAQAHAAKLKEITETPCEWAFCLPFSFSKIKYELDFSLGAEVRRRNRGRTLQMRVQLPCSLCPTEQRHAGLPQHHVTDMPSAHVPMGKGVQQWQSAAGQLTTGMPVCRCCFQVDIGCNTSVVGNGAVDENVPKTAFAHPLSMQAANYQWMIGRGNWRADPPDYGYYPANCPRYHRFRVIDPGNFTFVSGAAWHCLRTAFVSGLPLPFALWCVQWRPRASTNTHRLPRDAHCCTGREPPRCPWFSEFLNTSSANIVN